MIIRGTVEKGRVVILDSGSTLPIGTRVDVSVNRGGAAKKAKPADTITRIANRAINTGIPDLSVEHDAYAYGISKRSKGKRRSTK